MVKRTVLPLREKLLGSVKALGKKQCSVGYFADQGTHSGSNMSYPELMFLQEVHGVRSLSGLVHRRLFENTAIRHRADIRNNIRSSLKRSLMTDPNVVFTSFGKEVQGLLRKGFGDTGLLPSNAPATIARKGKNSPLVDTGELKSKLTYRVEPKRQK
ncbi:hypothetical protein [Enterobacter mori]